MENKRQLELIQLGQRKLKEGNHNAALTVFNQIIEVDDRCTDAYFNIANIFSLKGDIGKAIKMYHKVLELEPSHADASVALSILLNDIGRYEEAKKVFDKANDYIKNQGKAFEDINVNRQFSMKHYELAEMYYSYNRLDEAIFEYNKAVGLNPSNLEIRIKVAKAFSKKGLVSKAMEELKRLRNEYPSYAPAKIALGLLFFENGNVIEARAQWQNALSQDPLNEEAKMYLNLSNSATETNF